jgi:hypothetical protein
MTMRACLRSPPSFPTRSILAPGGQSKNRFGTLLLFAGYTGRTGREAVILACGLNPPDFISATAHRDGSRDIQIPQRRVPDPLTRVAGRFPLSDRQPKADLNSGDRLTPESLPAAGSNDSGDCPGIDQDCLSADGHCFHEGKLPGPSTSHYRNICRVRTEMARETRPPKIDQVVQSDAPDRPRPDSLAWTRLPE